MSRSIPPRWINSLFLVIVNLLWAAQYPAYKIAGDQMEPAALNFWTFAFATVFLLPFLARSGQQAGREKSRLSGRTVWDFILLGVLGIVPPSVMLAWGIVHSSASNGAILSLTIPLLMTLMGALLLGEKITRVRVVTLGLGLAGTLLVSVNDLQGVSFSRTLLLGNFVIFLAGAGSAFYNAYGKGLLRHFSETEVLVGSYITGGLSCGIISVLAESKPFYRVGGYGANVWGAVAVLGLLSWGVAMVMWMWVLNKLDVGQISVSIYLLPFFGLLVSVVTLHEHLNLVQLLGGAVVVVSTIVLTVFDKPQAEQVETLAGR
jgi:drug/metabolite transporter (DMT)-like permease